MPSRLSIRVARVVLPLVGCFEVVNYLSSFYWRGVAMKQRTLHHGILRRVDTIGDDQSCISLGGYSRVITSLWELLLIIPAAKKGAYGRTIDHVSSRRTLFDLAVRDSIDVQTGAGNLLRGVTPSQDILNMYSEGLRSVYGFGDGGLMEVEIIKASGFRGLSSAGPAPVDS